jgi:hypothetical protein
MMKYATTMMEGNNYIHLRNFVLHVSCKERIYI